MTSVLVIAPHPDDETIGCGGALLRARDEGNLINWMIMTSADERSGYSESDLERQNQQIDKVSAHYGFQSVHRLNFPAARLDTLPLADLVDKISSVITELGANVLYLPHPGDAHTDHRITFEAASACTKWFRHSSVKSVLIYETLSETNFSRGPSKPVFSPNTYIDIERQLQAKLEAMSLYDNQTQDFPFPRSFDAITSLARLRGSEAGYKAAEAFDLIFDRK